MTTLFVSDLHLDATRPAATQSFLELLAGECRQADALYILGDLFEAWIGDDDPDPHHREVIRALRALTDAGVPCAFVHGNRDFLVGRRFSTETGVHLLAEGSVIDLYGRPVLLMHGDSLCTDDIAYQRLRHIVRQRWLQRLLLTLPVNTRRKIALWARGRSQQAQSAQAPEIMDVNQDAVADALREAGVRHLVHGHTHRPAVHHFELDGKLAERWVLGDWYDQPQILRSSPSGWALSPL
ncbi:MAG: UDP-2,3-diacylglucosamine diphosphatase [Chromatiales bacterium]|nr:UDP-2,3-diacylglucosamine diphosphatase [Chromatiales bacterium]